MVICLERGADCLHMLQLMPLPLTVSCFSKIQIGFTFLLLAHPDSAGKRAVKRVRYWNCVHVVCDASFWDDWMRQPAQRRERACIRPEIPRTSTFGKIGVSKLVLFLYLLSRYQF